MVHDDALLAELFRLTLGIARATLRATGQDADFPLLDDMLATRRTPAHRMREAFLRGGAMFDRC